MKYTNSNGTVTIEAFQITQTTREDNSEWPEWLHKAWDKPIMKKGSLYPVHYPNSDGKDPLKLRGVGGPTILNWGDYIVKTPEGNLYKVDPKSFKEVFKPIKDA